MLDVKRLKVLKEVAAQGSFSAAADALGYTQSAVSQQIAALEKETGTTLVERGARGIRLTGSGTALVSHVDGILARLTAAEDELDAIAGLRGGRLRLGSFPTAGATLVPLAIKRFSLAHPGVELSLREAEPEDSLPMLKSGELDLALTFEYPLLPNSLYDVANEDIDRIHLLDDPMYVALPPDHPLATKKRLRLADLSDQAWVQGDCSGLCGAMQLKACENSGFIPRVAYETDDYNVVQGLVAAGVAVSMIAELALTNVRDDIVIRSLGTDAPARKVYAATLMCQYRSPAAAAMLDILREAADEYLASRRPAAVAASAAAA